MQQAKVLIGSGCETMIESYSDLLNYFLKNKYELKIFSAVSKSGVLELASNESIDIFILFWHNMAYGFTTIFKNPYYKDNHIDDSLQLIDYIKTKYKRPVIVLSALSSQKDYALNNRASLYADFFFQMPSDFEIIVEAMEKCFNMIPGFD